MKFSFSKSLKAAIYTAAFLFLSTTRASTSKIEVVKEYVQVLLVQKKKPQAIAHLNEFVETEPNKKIKEEAADLLIELVKKFSFKEAQEAYENSVNLTVESPSEAFKSNEKCLQLEPEQLECLTQKIRLLLRRNEKNEALEVFGTIKKEIQNHKSLNWIEAALSKETAEFKQKILIKTAIEKVDEENLGLLFLELERSFRAKNFSRAKEIMLFLEKKYSDWPDLLVYKLKINAESSEETEEATNKSEVDPKTIYKNKCKSLNKSAARLFRQDIYLCLRGA